jgi:hypothetical protein
MTITIVRRNCGSGNETVRLRRTFEYRWHNIIYVYSAFHYCATGILISRDGRRTVGTK